MFFRVWLNPGAPMKSLDLQPFPFISAHLLAQLFSCPGFVLRLPDPSGALLQPCLLCVSTLPMVRVLLTTLSKAGNLVEFIGSSPKPVQILFVRINEL